MTNTDAGKKTLSDVRAASKELRSLLENTNQLWSNRNANMDVFRPGSVAVSDASLNGYDRHVRGGLSFANLLIAAALDHTNELCLGGEGAADNKPTPVWAPWSVTRSLIEVCATVQWLSEYPLPTKSRAARTLSLERSEADSRASLGQDEVENLAEIARDVAALRINEIDDRRGRWLGYEAAIPSRTEMVKAVLQLDEDFRAYSMLSAVSHGETWAIYSFGYVSDGELNEKGLGEARKEPSAFWLWTALRLATIALQRGARSNAVYRGWLQ